ncbi:hypothetical protein PHYC_03892 [Phycisphaerales bacterium]|nr:hypothetical protein PHYC_03892 [Phycisphaerales bacterium]
MSPVPSESPLDPTPRAFTPLTIAEFLLGHRPSILRLWSDRWSLLIGAILVLAGSLARNYDGHHLLREWHVLLHGFGASVANAFLLYTLARLAVAIASSKPGDESVRRPHFWRGYLSFLGVFWMTAPMAWLYGIPYEHLLEPLKAVEANLWTLAAVSFWRVLLMARVLSVALDVPFWSVLFITLLFGDALALAALFTAPLPTIDFMGGLRHPPETQLIASTAFAAGFWALVTLPVWVIAALVGLRWLKPGQRSLPAPARFPIPKAACGMAVVAVAGWLAAGLATQPSVGLKLDVENSVKAGRYDQAASILAAHHRGEFPPIWDLPPRNWDRSPNYREALAGMTRAVAVEGGPTWFADAYSQKVWRELLRFRHGSEPSPAEAPLDAEVLPYDHPREDLLREIEFVLRFDTSISDRRREWATAVRDLLKASPPSGSKPDL